MLGVNVPGRTEGVRTFTVRGIEAVKDFLKELAKIFDLWPRKLTVLSPKEETKPVGAE